MLKAAESRRAQSQRDANFTRMRGDGERIVEDLSAGGDDERYLRRCWGRWHLRCLGQTGGVGSERRGHAAVRAGETG